MKKSVIGVLAAVLATALIAAGCGSGSGTTEGSSTVAETTGGSASGGTLVVAAPFSVRPWAFVNNGEKEGINVDFVTAVAERMGMDVEFENGSLETLIPGLENERFDIASGPISDNAEREEHVDFVDYAKGAEGVVVASGEAGNFRTVQDLCGATVGVVRGSVDQLILGEEECPEGSSIEIKVFNETNPGALAVRSGQIDGLATDSAFVGLLAKEDPDDFEASAINYAGGLIGVMLHKGSPMVEEVRQATQALIDSGKLKEIFAKWGSPEAALSEAQVNGEG